MRVTFPCGALTLEGDLATAPHCTNGAVVCHPHPQYGGDMDNQIVRAVAGALREAGFTTLRFNFRGVGNSGGSYGGGVGEVDDTRAAVKYLTQNSAVAVALAGYSFGAMVALRAGAQLSAVDRLIAIAPPLAFFDLSAIATSDKPKLFVVGEQDQYCRVAKLRQELAYVAEPKTQQIIAGADHFFNGDEAAVADAVRSFVQRAPSVRSTQRSRREGS